MNDKPKNAYERVSPQMTHKYLEPFLQYVADLELALKERDRELADVREERDKLKDEQHDWQLSDGLDTYRCARCTASKQRRPEHGEWIVIYGRFHKGDQDERWEKLSFVPLCIVPEFKWPERKKSS